jgi:hypothetical protein
MAVTPSRVFRSLFKVMQKIFYNERYCTGILDSQDYFGRSLAAIPDLNSDAIPELAVGASSDDDGGKDRGAVYVMFMLSTGTVSSVQKVSNINGEFTGLVFAYVHEMPFCTTSSIFYILIHMPKKICCCGQNRCPRG